MYVAVKGGAKAIAASHAVLAEGRRGDTAVPELATNQIEGQLRLAVDRVMAEGALYDQGLAALAVKQAQGDLQEAAFLLRAYRTTLPRFGTTAPVNTGAMLLQRRVSATYKDLPGGQILGPTFDYTHRLLDFALLAENEVPPAPRATPDPAPAPRVTELLARENLMRREASTDATPTDLTRAPLTYPADRSARLQNLARGDEGFVLAMGYSTQRGYGGAHPFVGEIRYGSVAVELVPEEVGFAVDLGDMELTECQMVNQFGGSRTEPPQFTRGYGLAFGHNERKVMGMALVDRALMARELGEDVTAPAQDEEFVLSHTDNVEASGFVQHLKLPHYVDFQSELELIRTLRAEAQDRAMPKAAE
jgi:alpha-D-ribose 1-methylphosphonate 5-triphosphate synthase subunit PhnI